jgi:hypothetical protein
VEKECSAEAFAVREKSILATLLIVYRSQIFVISFKHVNVRIILKKVMNGMHISV